MPQAHTYICYALHATPLLPLPSKYTNTPTPASSPPMSSIKGSSKAHMTYAFIYAAPVVKSPACAVSSFMIRVLNALCTLLQS